MDGKRADGASAHLSGDGIRRPRSLFIYSASVERSEIVAEPQVPGVEIAAEDSQTLHQ